MDGLLWEIHFRPAQKLAERVHASLIRISSLLLVSQRCTTSALSIAVYLFVSEKRNCSEEQDECHFLYPCKATVKSGAAYMNCVFKHYVKQSNPIT